MNYQTPDSSIWTGRTSENQAYFHEKIVSLSFEELPSLQTKSYVLLGYACDEGVRRNKGRIGAKQGPNEIRKHLAKTANHLASSTQIFDIGDVICIGQDLESAQETLTKTIAQTLNQHVFPVLIGGGHDIAYPHYQGLRKHILKMGEKPKIGIINLDAHFDLRKPKGEGTSGTPFYQIAETCSREQESFNYLCLGIQPLSNIPALYETAQQFGVSYIERKEFTLANINKIFGQIEQFAKGVNHLYLTIDLDGFSAAESPGVSAPSPLGFETALVIEVIDFIIQTGKLMSMDVAELNPIYDVDAHSARLAAYLIGHVLRNLK